MAYNDTFNKLNPDPGVAFKTSLPAVQDNVTELVGAYTTDAQGIHHPKNDFNEILQDYLNNLFALKNIVDALGLNKLDKGNYSGTAANLKADVDTKLPKGSYSGDAGQLKTAIDTKLAAGTYTGNAGQLKLEIDTKQPKNDSALTTSNKTVAGAINELNSNVGGLQNDIVEKLDYIEVTDIDTELVLQASYYEGIDSQGTQFSVRVGSTLEIPENSPIKDVAGYVRLQGVSLPCKLAIRNYPMLTDNTAGPVLLEIESNFVNAGDTEADKSIQTYNRDVYNLDTSKLEKGGYTGTAQDLEAAVKTAYDLAGTKEPKFSKNSGFNKVMVDVPEDDSTKVLSAKGGKYLDDKIDNLISGGTEEASLTNTAVGGIYVRWSV